MASAWSYSAGERGANRVRVFEKDSGLLMLEFYEHTNGQLARKRVSLGHRDREAAKLKADEVAAKFRAGVPAPVSKPTVGQLFDIYEREVSPGKSRSAREHDARAFRLFEALVGRGRDVATLSRRDWDRFIAARREGTLRPPNSRVARVRDRVIEQNLKAVLAVFNWAVTVKDEAGRELLEKNPLKGLELPTETSPLRQIFTPEQLAGLFEYARRTPLFLRALQVAYYTGHRIGAVRHLRWSDLDFDRQEIHWRSEFDKLRRDHVTPFPAALVAILKPEKPEVDGWVFPSWEDPSKPASRHLVRDWMEEGLKAIGIPPGKRYGWHSLRRRFATDLKTMPLADLCALGGWTDSRTLVKCYTQPDMDTMRAALAGRQALAGVR